MKEVSIKKLVVLLSSFIVIAVMITTALIMTNKAGSFTDVSSGEEKNSFFGRGKQNTDVYRRNCYSIYRFFVVRIL